MVEPSALVNRACRFEPLVHAFNLDGDGPRFLQDQEELDSDAQPIERLLIEAPGDSTADKKTDAMVHRDRFDSFGRPAAAIALYTLQVWAPSGGAGNRTGMRGGGPLVTLVLPGEKPTLWQTLWANVPTGGRAPAQDELPRVFPWLTATPSDPVTADRPSASGLVGNAASD
jgi:CRISPR system Cascade subunit CasA